MSEYHPRGYGPLTDIIFAFSVLTVTSYLMLAALILRLYHVQENGLGSLIGQSAPFTEQ